MKLLIFASFFMLYCQEITSMKTYGDYYIENEGFIPGTFLGNPVSYKIGLTRSQYNKLITGKFFIFRKVGPIGLHVTIKRNSDGSKMGLVKIPSICNMEYPLEPFRKAFAGKIDDDCCIEAGNYTLTKWTLEDHVRPQLKSFFYGKFTINLRVMENEKDCMLEMDIEVTIKDRDHLKKADENKNQNKGTGEDEEIKNPRRKNKGKSKG